MTTTTARLAAASLFTVFAFGASTVQAEVVASATGHYEATYGATRAVSFTAMRDSENNTRGQVQFLNRDTGVMMHLSVDCLHVEGNVATMSGQVADRDLLYSGDVALPYFWVRVIDNGEGADAVDYASPFVSSDVELPCQSTVFDWVFPSEGGNIQVREK